MVFKGGKKVDEIVGANPPRLEVRELIIDAHLHVTDKSDRSWCLQLSRGLTCDVWL
jgi:hypothetical protein